MNLINKVNGYKTIIGLVTLAIGFTSLSRYISTEEATVIIDQAITTFGAVMTLIGLCHKVYKKIQTM